MTLIALTESTADREANRAAIVFNCMLEMVVQIQEIFPVEASSRSGLFDIRYKSYTLQLSPIRPYIHLASGSLGC